MPCPVCRWPDQGSPACRRCGWELQGGYVAGLASADDERDLAARLAEWRWRHDLRAAARAAGSIGERDPEVLSRLAKLVRGSAPTTSLLQRVLEELDASEPPLTATQAGTGFALTRLVAEETDGIAFVEIGPDAISVETLVADELRVPTRRPGGDSLAWPAVLPLLPAEADLRWLRLAGGIGAGRDDDLGRHADQTGTADPTGTDPAILAAAVDETVKHVLARLSAAASAAVTDARGGRRQDDSAGTPSRVPPCLDVVLVRRTHRWPLLEAAAAQARTILRPVAEIAAAPRAGTLADVVDETARRAPIRYGYSLMLVAVDPRSGEVRPDPWPVFPAGTAVRPDNRQIASVSVLAPAHASRQLALPIVARCGADPARWPLVRMAAIDGRATGPTRLRLRLTAPGRLSIRSTPDLLPRDTAVPSWPGLLAGLPRRLPRTSALDLVLLVELGGRADAVAARVRLVRGVVGAFRAAASVQIAVVGYRDHFGKHRVDATHVQEREALIVGCGLGQADGARSALASPERWQAVPIGDDHAAPLEDALQLITKVRWDWRQGARHVLLVVASRPPHPPTVGPHGDLMLPCPHRFSWRQALGQLRSDQAAEFIAVLDDRAARGQARDYAEGAWKQFAAQGRFTLETATPERLAQVIGLATGNDTPRLCLAARAWTTPPPGTRAPSSRKEGSW